MVAWVEVYSLDSFFSLYDRSCNILRCELILLYVLHLCPTLMVVRSVKETHILHQYIDPHKRHLERWSRLTVKSVKHAVYLLSDLIEYFTVILEYIDTLIYCKTCLSTKKNWLVRSTWIPHHSCSADSKLHFYVFTYDYIWAWGNYAQNFLDHQNHCISKFCWQVT